MFIRHPYNYDRNQASIESGLHCTDPTRARQEFRDETDINLILAKFNITGQIDLDGRTPLQGDFSDVPDYRSMQDQLNAAKASFMALPAEIRKRFGNDPAEFVEYTSDPANIEEIRKLGLGAEQPDYVFTLADVVKAIEKQTTGKPLPES